MMKSALSIVQSMRRRLNLPVPTALVSSTDPDELQMTELLYAVLEDLRQARVFTQQKRSFSISTATTSTKYKLPKDYYSPVLRTHWNEDETNVLVGPASDAEFNWRLYGDVASSLNYTYRIFGWDQNPNTEGGQFEVNPTPASVQTLRFDYITRHTILPPHWLPSTAYTTADYVNVNGNIYKCSSNGTSSAADPPSGQTTAITDGTAEWDYYNDPYEVLITDSDLCLFDYDLVALGLRAKWMEDHGGDYQQAKFEYDTKIDKAVARYKGSFVGDFANKKYGPRYHVPYRSWSI